MEASARMAKNAATARQLAAESMVLLKNVGNTLPLLGSPEDTSAALAQVQEELCRLEVL